MRAPPSSVDTQADARNGPRARVVSEGLERGAAVGRYLVLSKIGQGGMGVVYAAYDPELDRRIALKLLHDDGIGSESLSDHRRLLREAQAMARLSHPNVLTIHDVGEHVAGSDAPAVFIAMEFVEGRTLGEWLHERRRGWRETLEVYMQAGVGLAAAHANGLVHRDFKPDNVMVAADGRVKVMDFGLARPTGHATDKAEGAGQPRSDALSAVITLDEGLVGTPAYMAPEQFMRDREVGAAADQFSFCVALWEALFGERPFGGKDVAALLLRVTAGEISDLPSGVNVPTWLVRVLRRGLSRDPDARWPSMTELLLALRRDPTRRRRIMLGLGVAVVAVGSGVGWNALAYARARTECEREGETITQIWNADRADAIGNALADLGIAHAEQTWLHTRPRLDEWADAWASLRTTVCREAEIDSTRNAASLQLARQCFDERRDELAAMLDHLSEPDATIVHRVPLAIEPAMRLAECRDDAWLDRRAQPPEDPTTRDAIRSVRAELAAVTTALALADHATAGKRIGPALESAEALDWPPLLAEAKLVLGRVRREQAQYDTAEAITEEAYYLAAAASHDVVAIASATELGSLVGTEQARHKDGLRWCRIAQTLIDRLQLSPSLPQADLLRVTAAIRLRMAAPDEALRDFEAALAIYERTLGSNHPKVASAWTGIAGTHAERGEPASARIALEHVRQIEIEALGPRHPDVASTWNNIGHQLRALGDYDAAKEAYLHGLQIREQSLPADHPDIAESCGSVGIMHFQRGELDEALTWQSRALAIREQTFGPDHIDLSYPLLNLANVYWARGDLDLAAQHYRRALAIREATLGLDHPDVARVLNNLGGVVASAGDLDEAMPLFQRALAIFETAQGPDHPAVAVTLDSIAATLERKGDHDGEMAVLERALAIRERRLGPEHPDLTGTLMGIGNVHVARGERAQAIASYERSLAIHDAARTDPVPAAKTRFALAKARWDADDDRSRAHQLATIARTDLAAAGDRERETLAEIDRWLAQHAEP